MPYLKLGLRMMATLRQLGCPNRNSFKAWGAEFEQNQKVFQGEQDFGEEIESAIDRSHLMVTLDKLNQRLGKGMVHAAATGAQGERRLRTMRRQFKTPEYATM